jgi:hypothetical protein
MDYGVSIAAAQALIIHDRFLQDDNSINATVVPTSAPTPSPNSGNGTPTNGDTNTDNDSMLAEKEGAMKFGIVFLAAFVVVLLFVGFKSFKYWKLKRERYMLQVQSSRADAVLGDMQVCMPDFDCKPFGFLYYEDFCV